MECGSNSLPADNIYLSIIDYKLSLVNMTNIDVFTSCRSYNVGRGHFDVAICCLLSMSLAFNRG